MPGAEVVKAKMSNAHGLDLLSVGMWCSHCRRPFLNPRTGMFFQYVGRSRGGKPWRFKKGIAFCDSQCASSFSGELAMCLSQEPK
jgi:hypothetical protein